MKTTMEPFVTILALTGVPVSLKAEFAEYHKAANSRETVQPPAARTLTTRFSVPLAIISPNASAAIAVQMSSNSPPARTSAGTSPTGLFLRQPDDGIQPKRRQCNEDAKNHPAEQSHPCLAYYISHPTGSRSQVWRRAARGRRCAPNRRPRPWDHCCGRLACSIAIWLMCASAFAPEAPSMAFTAMSCTCRLPSSNCFCSAAICCAWLAIVASSVLDLQARQALLGLGFLFEQKDLLLELLPSGFRGQHPALTRAVPVHPRIRSPIKAILAIMAVR